MGKGDRKGKNPKRKRHESYQGWIKRIRGEGFFNLADYLESKRDNLELKREIRSKSREKHYVRIKFTPKYAVKSDRKMGYSEGMVIQCSKTKATLLCSEGVAVPSSADAHKEYLTLAKNQEQQK